METKEKGILIIDGANWKKMNLSLFGNTIDKIDLSKFRKIIPQIVFNKTNRDIIITKSIYVDKVRDENMTSFHTVVQNKRYD